MARPVAISPRRLMVRSWRWPTSAVVRRGCWPAARSSTSSRTATIVRIVSADGRYLLRATLADIERRWEPFGFVRVHRQYVANLHRAIELRPQLGGTADLAFADGQTIPIARRHVAELGRRWRL